LETTTSKSDLRLSVIIPAYNEEGNLEELCHQFDEMGRKAPFSFEVIIVDDGSTDRSGEVLRTLEGEYSFLCVETHNRNMGLTEALYTGFYRARGEIFLFYPADLQYRPEDIPRMIARIDEGYDLVTGWKQGPYAKRFISNIYNFLSRRIFRLKVHDLNSVKAFRREVVEDIFLRKDWHRYLVALAVERGYRVDEVRMPLYPRYSGRSKFSGLRRIPVGFLDMLAVKSQLTLLRKPLLFFGFPGLGLICAGILVGLVALYLRFVENAGFRPLLYLVILLMVTGILFFVLGFLAEAMTAIKEEFTGIRKTIRQLEKKLERRRDD
jgi:glycosyltransferase involved in cell wall biosynthesis